LQADFRTTGKGFQRRFICFRAMQPSATSPHVSNGQQDTVNIPCLLRKRILWQMQPHHQLGTDHQTSAV
jgi:hypothetical protein